MRQKISFEIKSIIIIMFCIIGIRGIIYEIPQSQPFIGKYAYDLVTRGFSHVDIKRLKNDIKVKEEISLYFLGRGSCSDCRENIKNIKTLSHLSKQKYGIAVNYIQLDESLDETKKDFLKELEVESIPTMLLVTKEGIRQFDIYDISATNHEDKFDIFIGGEL